MQPFRATALLGAIALAATFAGTALAHGPTRQKVTETIEINAPAEKVWAVIGNFQDMSWLPLVEKTTGEGGNEPDKAHRTLFLKGGAVIPEESLEKYDAAAFTYSYRITKEDVKVLPVTNYSSRITVTADGDKSKVEWRGAFYRGFPNNDPPPELSDEAAIKAVTGVYQAGLQAVKKKLEGGS
jgi:Polyketide cyclase / dehydrase and lipid transport